MTVNDRHGAEARRTFSPLDVEELIAMGRPHGQRAIPAAIEQAPLQPGRYLVDDDVVRQARVRGHQLPPTKKAPLNWETIGYYHLPFKLILTAQ